MGNRISFELPCAGQVRLSVYNLAGQRVGVLIDGTPPTAPSPRGEGRVGSVTWDGRDQAGRRVSNGVYLVRLESGGQAVTGRMLVLR